MNYLKIFCWITIALLALQCGSSEKPKAQNKCDAPLPQAIFGKDVSGVASHSFALKGHNATENISFNDKSSLVIFQSGCDKISQEFRFKVPSQKEVDMPSLGIERLMFLANLEDQFMSFANWAQAIDGLRRDFATQNEVEVEAGFFVGLDKIDSKDHTTMIIRLFQK